MKPRSLFLYSLSLLLLLVAATPSASAQSPDEIPNATLAKAPSDAKVFYIENGKKRWIASELAFLSQNFRWEDINIVDAARLNALPTGQEITGSAFLGLPINRVQLPDLAPVAPYDLRFSEENGRTLLRFTATFWNRGKGALELNADPGDTSGDGEFPAHQRLFRPDGSFTDQYVGTLFFHETHDHYHYQDFGNYVLELQRPAAGETQAGAVSTNKTTFCLRDDVQIGAPSDGEKQPRTYTGCNDHKQGVSVGWADAYRYTLPDQYVDATNLPAGIYKLSFVVDHMTTFAESRRDNNESATLVELDPSRRIIRVLATGSPYQAGTNNIPDGTLIRAEGDPKVYAVNGNEKRWLRTEEVFRSYGRSWSEIYVLPPAVVDAIPSENLIRVQETGRIYVLNNAGYRRRILNPDVFRSYGWADGDVALVNQVEANNYPETDLISRSGSDRIYSLSSRKNIGTLNDLDSLGRSRASVHFVNDTDFRSYAVSVIARDLTIPWDIAFLPDGDKLVTERTGTLKRVGEHPATFAIPSVHTNGEGGLMGIALHPDFAQNNFVYLYYTTNEDGRKNRVVRYRLLNNNLTFDRMILDNIPSATYHDGGQIEFGPDGKLYIATGDATNPDSAQDTGSLAGKILRVNDDGSTPADNPFGNAVWSYGHRNPQGLAWDEDGTLYIAEHGPTGEFGLCCRDEVNRIQKGGNYGWPVITGNQTRVGMIAPFLTSGGSVTWAPSALAYLDGSLYFSGLRASTLYEAQLRQDGSAGLNAILSDTYGRLRAAVVGPNQHLYITTSNRDGRGSVRTGDDKVLRIHTDFLK